MIKHILKQIRLLSNARKEPYLSFYKVLGFYPDKIKYYQSAISHKSVLTPTKDGHLSSNERLEFLGDAVLSSVVTDILYHRYDKKREGFLTNTRSKIVKRDSLNLLAVEIGLDKLVKVTKYVNAHTNNNIYGNALEALMGAIYIDQGYRQCKKFVEKQLFRHIDLNELTESEVNFKSKLIEWCQKNHFESDFILLNETLTDKNKHRFESEVIINGHSLCIGAGSSKKASQQQAAHHALDLIEDNPDIIDILKNRKNKMENSILEQQDNSREILS